MKICKDGRVWGQNNKKKECLGTLTWKGKYIKKGTRSESKRGSNNPMYGIRLCGEKHWHWQGGITEEGYPFNFNNELKELIRKRDNYTCQLCGKAQGDELKEFNRKLSVHHIDYDKENLDPKNLTTLCAKCNVKVNFGREDWTNYFQEKVKWQICFNSSSRQNTMRNLANLTRTT